MVRTQVYLTQKERHELAALAEATGKKQSELIRDAVDRLLEGASATRRDAALARAAGLWKDRKDLPDFRALAPDWIEVDAMSAFLLVDTDVMVDYLRGQAQAVSFLKRHAEQVILPAIVVAELYAGVKGDGESSVLDDLVSLFRVAAVTAEISKAGGLLKRNFGKSHGVGLADAIVAATAQAHGAQLATLNVKHYPMFPGLKFAYVKK